MKFFSRAVFAALAILLAFPALADEGHNAEAITFTNAYARAMPPAAKTGGGFVTITNSGTTDDALLRVTSPVAGEVQLHETVMENDIMKMGPIEGKLALPAGEALTFEPGGLHLMFMQVDVPFAEGDEVPVTLYFEHAGAVGLVLPVGPIGASAMPMENMQDH